MEIKKHTEIERSIIKKYRKTIWRGFIKSIQKYDLIKENDKIAVCISGGKDSMLLAKLMQEIQKHGKFNFDLKFMVMNPGYSEENMNKIINNAKILNIPITVFDTDIFDIVAEIEENPCYLWVMNPGYSEENMNKIINNAKILNIPITVFDTDIFDIVAEIEENPCYLCARMRRGHLYSKAKELGCNKIALGHHFDDVIETILMGMIYGQECVVGIYIVKQKSLDVIK